MISHSMVSLTFFLVLSFESVYAAKYSTSRRLKSPKTPKSPKSPKQPQYLKLPKKTCLLTGYAIEGTPNVQTFDTFDRIATECLPFISDGDAYEKCVLENYLETAFSAPFQYALNGISGQLQFVTTDESLIGKGSLKGSIPSDSTDGADKVILTYMSSNYIAGVNNELWNRPVSDFEYIEYSFKVDACKAPNTACPEQFYLNVYTRSSASITDFYGCRYDFVPATGGVVGGDWTTVRVEIGDSATNAQDGSGTDKCPISGPDTLQNAADNGYVLGTNAQSPLNIGQIFALNMGDSSTNDNGLIGYFDQIVVKLQGQDPLVFDLEASN